MADALIRGTTIIEDKRNAGTTGLVWSCTGVAFIPIDNTVAASYASSAEGDMDMGSAARALADVSLPNGAKITRVIVYGSDATEPWTLIRKNIIANTNETLATANTNTEDTSISNDIIDNLTYAYYLKVEVDAGDEMFGASITYTT